jgi:hypothetical protein
VLLPKKTGALGGLRFWSAALTPPPRNRSSSGGSSGGAGNNASSRGHPRNSASQHPGLAVDWDVDANDDGFVDERDWDILEEEAARRLDVRLDAALGERFWVGPLPLSAADRRLCGAVMGAARTVATAVAALAGVLAIVACVRRAGAARRRGPPVRT